MKNMRCPLILLFLISLPAGAAAQVLEKLALEEAYQYLAENYPLLKNASLNEAIHDLELKKLETDRLPGIQWKADGRLQSETPRLEGEGMLPINIDLPLYSVKTYLEATYLLYDGGMNEAQRAQKAAQLLVDQQSLAVEQYQLREQINRLFLNILLSRERTKLLAITLDDLAARQEVLEAGVQYGVVLESELAKIRVRRLEIESEQENLRQGERGLLATLEILTGKSLTSEVELVLPGLPEPAAPVAIDRPEEKRFQLQKQALLANESLLTAQLKPKVGVFAQAGVGLPNPLNFFDNEPAPYGILGVNFQMPITDWKKNDYERQILQLRTQQIDHQNATFRFNLETLTGRYLAEVERLQKQIEYDQRIAGLQAEILEQLAAQLDNGVITAVDYLSQVNAELQTRQQLELHRMQLIQLQLEYLQTRGWK